MKVIVFGGTRFMGVHAVARLAAAGHEVSVVHRGSARPPAVPGLGEVIGDRDDADTLARVAATDPEAVVDFSAYREAQTVSALEALPGVRRWVHCSTGAVYRPAPVFPWREEGPLGPWPLWGGYGVEKLGCERRLREDAARRGRVAVALRPPYVLGPGNYAPREEFVLNRILDGEPVLVPGDGKALLHMVSARDAGAAFAAAVDAPLEPGFHPVNLASPDACSGRGFIDLCASVAGRPADVRHVDARPTGEVFDPGDAVFPFPDEPYLLDTTRQQDLGLVPEPERLDDVVQQAYAHLIAHQERRQWSPGPREQAARASLGLSARPGEGSTWPGLPPGPPVT